MIIKKIKNILFFVTLVTLNCTSLNIINNRHFNKEDQEYLYAKLNKNTECLSYYLKGYEKCKITFYFILNKNGKIDDVIISNKNLANSLFAEKVKLFYKDTCRNFVSIDINKKRKFMYEYDFFKSADAPCDFNTYCGERGGYLGNDIIVGP